MIDIRSYACNIQKISNKEILTTVEQRLNSLTKPLGSLGYLEEIVKKYCLIQNTLTPSLNKKLIIVYASDHGIAEEGVSLYPQEVTKQMVYNFINGGAGINVLARDTNSLLYVVDIGVKGEIRVNHPNFISKKISHGTKIFVKQQAMTYEEATNSITTGIELTEELIRRHQPDVVIAGDMGIGNTTSASAITSVVLNVSPEEVTGYGTGVGDKLLKRKIHLIKAALELHKPNISDPIDILSKVGGFEFGGICGTILAAAKNRKIFISDGFIVTTSLLLATYFNCHVLDYTFAGHCSAEPGHKKQLEFLGLRPLIDLDMRLGEGTGAALAIKVIESALKLYNEMATFESAGVSKEIMQKDA